MTIVTERDAAVAHRMITRIQLRPTEVASRAQFDSAHLTCSSIFACYACDHS